MRKEVFPSNLIKKEVNKMKNKIKSFCMSECDLVYYHGGNLEKAIDRCYGAVMFCINNCFNDYNEELAKWWDDEMLPRLRELERR